MQHYNLHPRRHRFTTALKSGIAILVLGLLAGVVIPNIITAKKALVAQKCQMRMAAIEDAKEAWADANDVDTTQKPSLKTLKAYSKITLTDTCPRGKKYQIGSLSQQTRCPLHGYVYYSSYR